MSLDWTVTSAGDHSVTVNGSIYVITVPGKGRRRPFIVYFPEGPSATTDTLREAKALVEEHAAAAHVEPEEECTPDDVEAMIGSMIGSTVLQIVRQTERQAQAVQLARDHGLSWAWIGRHLGVTRQSAQDRFGKKTPPRPPQTEGLDL